MSQSRLEEIRNIRLAKLQKLRDLGIDPYPPKFSRPSTSISTALSSPQQTVNVVGRIWRLREHGNAIFADLRDATGQIQLLFQKKNLPQQYSPLKLFDLGDFLGVTGQVTTTQSGQITIDVSYFELLGKSLRPLPDTWDGLKDKEIRFRRRYLDTNINPEVRQRFIRRSRFWEAHREFFKNHDFIEINIPVLEHIPGGGDAHPFVTHMDAIDQDFYLRISQELYLKRLIGGGFEKVYEIGPRFRNEGLSDEHLPEHIAMEFYWAYADWQDGMQLVEDLFQHILDFVYAGQTKFTIRGFTVDFSQGWDILDFGELFKQQLHLDVYHPDLPLLKKVLDSHRIPYLPHLSIPRAVDLLWKQLRKDIGGPVFLVNHPKYLSPLQKPSSTHPDTVERFQPIIGGSELGNGWSEVNDPVDQFERFSQQQRLRDAGDPEAQWLDIDYVEMLEYGMPPTFGYGHSERVFWFLEDVSAREGVPFPQLRFELDPVTKHIYHLNDLPSFPKSSPPASGYSISSSVKQAFSGISFAYLKITGINVKKAHPELERLKAQIVSQYTRPLNQVAKLPAIASYRQMFKATGVDYHSRRPSPEALLRRLAQGKSLYNINTAVDAYNLAVIETGIGLGGFDLSHIVEPVTLRFSQAGEKLHLLGDKDPSRTQAGELVYADAEKLLTLDLNYRDIDQTKITEKTKDVILFADGGPGIDPEAVKSALQKGAAYIQQFSSGNIEEPVLIQ